MENVWLLAALWMGLALAASLISVRLGVSVALVEIVTGILVGNAFPLPTEAWINVIAGFGSVLLTFLAGAEIEPDALRRHLKPSLAIGTAAFVVPFVGVAGFAYFVAGWDLRGAEIAGIALSTTSVAVVYAVMLETRLNETDLGKLILSACFVNDLLVVLALGLLFAHFDAWMAVFVAATALALWLLPRMNHRLRPGETRRVSEPELKFLFLILFLLGGLSVSARSEAVLPAYLIGLVTAGAFAEDRTLLHRMQSLAFALLTPFFFIQAGALVSLPAVLGGAGLVVALFAMKVASKSAGVWPLTGKFKLGQREGIYTTLLMSTGLTFGSISALFGLRHGIIDQAQYAILVTVVIASAVIPTVIAQTWFRPDHRPSRSSDLGPQAVPASGK